MPEARALETLSELGKATFKVILERGEATRPIIATEVGVSFATATYVLAELRNLELVRELRREQGARGRSTVVYGVAETAGWVLAVDIGYTQVSYTARSIDGTLLGSGSQAVNRGDGFEPARQAAAAATGVLRKHKAQGPPLVVGIAVNQVVPKSFEDQPFGSNPRDAHDIVGVFMRETDLGPDVPVLVDNNVNCAAVAEHATGMMEGLDDCAYVQIGVGIGLGFFADGSLIRGGSGASGELAQIPLSWSADVDSPQDAIEQAYGSRGVLASARERWPEDTKLPASTEDVFARARDGHPVAQAVMREHAIGLARIVAAAATVIDPTVVVLGGGLSRADDFVTMIQAEFASRTDRTELRVSSKGTTATVEGAAILARDLALSRMLGSHHRALLGRPALWGEGQPGQEKEQLP